MTAPHPERDREFEPVYHHYGPHRAGLPPLIPYFRELWHRRAFAAEMSKAECGGRTPRHFFGQLWLILNPLLLAGVYYLLVTIIRGQHDPSSSPICASTCLRSTWSPHHQQRRHLGDRFWQAADEHSVPRLLIPLSAVRTAFFRFLPTVPVYFVFHLIFLTDVWHPKMLLSVYFLGTMVLFGMGCAAFFSALQVYFRDTSSFLPFFVRIWMYLSPVLWKPGRRQLARSLQTLVQLNPMYSMLGGYTELMQDPVSLPYMWLTAGAWAVVVVGDRVPVLHVPGA